MGMGRSGLVDHDEVVNAREKIVRPQQLFRSISKLYGDLPQGAPDGKHSTDGIKRHKFIQ